MDDKDTQGKGQEVAGTMMTTCPMAVLHATARNGADRLETRVAGWKHKDTRLLVLPSEQN